MVGLSSYTFFYLSLSLRLSPQRKDTQFHASANERDVPVWSTRILDACRRPTPEISDPLHHPRPPDDIVALQLRMHGRRQISRFVFCRGHNINLKDEHTVKVPTVYRAHILIISFFPQSLFSSSLR